MTRKTSPEADDDFAQIYTYGLEKFGRRDTERYAIGLLDMFDKLAVHPFLGRQRSEVSPPVWLFPYRAHNILYAIRGDDVVVLRVVHGSVDWLSLFSGHTG